jgi:hypothetical protein
MMWKLLKLYDKCFKMLSARFGSSFGLILDLLRPLCPRLTEVAQFAPYRNDEVGDVYAQQMAFECLLTRGCVLMVL